MVKLPEHTQLILFDGVCNLCNNSVQFVIKHDPKNTFVFATLQGKIGQEIKERFHLEPSKLDSILLYTQDGKLYAKSTAALKIAKDLRFPVNLWRIFLIIPVGIRNRVYNWVAKNRYRWFGKRDACMVPTPELQSKFLD